MSERSPRTESELVQFVRAIDVRAPEDLHTRIGDLIAQRSTTTAAGGRRRLPFGRPNWLGARLGAIAAMAAVAIAVLVVALTGASSSAPMSLGRAYALTQGASAMPAPAPGTVGERIERVGAHKVTTVVYEGYGGRRIGYAIVAGTPAPKMSGGTVERVGETSYRVMSVNGGRLVSWVRDGRLCVIGGQHVSAGTLLALASWS
jgi:hypothetical protein